MMIFKIKYTKGGNKMKVICNEIVFRGHPDKLADQISDNILVEYLNQDKNSIVNIEVVGGENIVFVTGEAFSSRHINIQETVKSFLADVGCCANHNIIDEVEKKDLKDLVDIGNNENVIVYGYACNETDKLLPKGILVLQDIAKEYEKLRHKDKRFLPDGKIKMEGLYDKNDRLIKINSLIVNHQNVGNNSEEINNKMSKLIYDVTKKYDVLVEEVKLNPYGPYLTGGFHRDTGLTGRKLDIDSYQGFAPASKKTLSGKDPHTPARSGFYKAREIAKQTLIENNLNWCEVQINYANNTHSSKPICIIINCEKGLLEVPNSLYEECKPINIVNELSLLNADLINLSSFGHIQS